MIVRLESSVLRERHVEILAGTPARYNRSSSHGLACRATLGVTVECSNEKVPKVMARSCAKL